MAMILIRSATVLALTLLLVRCGGDDPEPDRTTEESTIEVTEPASPVAVPATPTTLTVTATSETGASVTSDPTAEPTQEPTAEATEESTIEVTEPASPVAVPATPTTLTVTATSEPTAEPTPEPVTEATEESIDHAAVALETVSAWVDSNIDELAAAAVEAVMESPAIVEQLEEVPSLLRGSAATLLKASLESRVEEGLTTELSVAIPLRDWLFTVILTTMFEDEVDLPVVGKFDYEVRVPVDITVDAAEREVEEWGLGTVTVEMEPSGE